MKARKKTGDMTNLLRERSDKWILGGAARKEGLIACDKKKTRGIRSGADYRREDPRILPCRSSARRISA